MAEEKKEEPAKAANENKVTITVTRNGETKSVDVRFHTPSLLAKINEELGDGDTVKLEVLDPGASEKRTLLEGTKKEAVAALEKSIVPPERIADEMRKFTQFLLDHSSLRAIGVNAICVDRDGKDAGFGFAATSEDCTTGQAIAMVNCGDANMDEFVKKAKLDVPGRGTNGGIIAPTQEQVEKLG